MASNSDSIERAPWLWPRAAYIHVPFCAHHCGYCDFAVATGQDDKIDQYIEALQAELSGLQQPQPIQTLSLGGGTPTYLNHRQLEKLLSVILSWFSLADDCEFSIEANPVGLDADKVSLIAALGVNRVSLGGQSFDPRFLKTLERDHQPDDLRRSFDISRQHIEHVSLDLIFGIPEQTPSDWDHDLRQALALEPDHLSTYGLTFEKGTRLWKQMRQGQVQPLSEETELEMYTHAMDTLADAAYEHYEISNFARPGCRSRHNQVYWANHAYFGFGMGAARYIQGKREVNSRDLTTYLRRALTGQSPTFQSETLTPQERARETIGLNLRRKEGIQREAFRAQTGYDANELAGETFSKMITLNYMIDDETGLRLTRQGKCVADAVMRQFWN